MVRVLNDDADLPLFAAVARRFLSVSELNELIKGSLESHLDTVWVQGEISNFRVPPSGHCYFTLKDDRSQICAVMFRRQGSSLRFTPENGMAVLCFGRVSVYTVRGDLQLYVEEIEPQGQGALYIAFEQLKKKLLADGLFAEERKRRLPFLPSTIGIVTSDGGAALRDMLRIIDDRYSDRRGLVLAVKVQGGGAAGEIARAIYDFNRLGDVDVMIVGRGGGSLEDLWAFNEEVVARAIYASLVPVISAVGHEIDYTIADFVADHRAPTPTAAAEMVVARREDLAEAIQGLAKRFLRCVQGRLAGERDALAGFAKRTSDPTRRVRDNQQHLDDLSLSLSRRFQDHLVRLRRRLAHGSERLNGLSPLAVLDRGYSIVHTVPDGAIVKDTAMVSVGERLRITFARGKALCRIEEKE